MESEAHLLLTFPGNKSHCGAFVCFFAIEFIRCHKRFVPRLETNWGKPLAKPVRFLNQAFQWVHIEAISLNSMEDVASQEWSVFSTGGNAPMWSKQTSVCLTSQNMFSMTYCAPGAYFSPIGNYSCLYLPKGVTMTWRS